MALSGRCYHFPCLTDSESPWWAISLFLCFFLSVPHSMRNPSSLTRDQTHAPCFRISESQSLDHQGSSISLSAADTIHVLATPSVTGLRRGACVSLFPIGLYSVKGKTKNYDAFENLPDNFQVQRLQ